jgi:hypothetical protein
LQNVENVTVRQSNAPALAVSGPKSRKIVVQDTPATLSTAPEVSKDAIVRR